MKLSFLTLFLGIYAFAFAQEKVDKDLAMSFYTYKDYPKAEVYFQKIYDDNIKEIFPYYYHTLIEQKKYREAEAISNKAIEKYNQESIYYFYKGKVYYYEQDSVKSNKYWREAIDYAYKSDRGVSQLNQLFKEIYQWSSIEELIKKFNKKNNNKIYLNQLVEAQFRQGKYEEGIQEVLTTIEGESQNYMEYLYGLQEQKDNKALMRAAEKAVYTRLNKNPNEQKWNDIATWLSLTIEDFDYAIQLSISNDKRLQGSGQKVVEIADIARTQKAYKEALKGYRYVINSPTSQNWKQITRSRELETMMDILNQKEDSTLVSIKEVDTTFRAFITTYPIDESTVSTYILYANYLAKNQHNLDSAIIVLQSIIDNPHIKNSKKAIAKVALGDYLLASGQIWEASLLYGQVGKEEKDSPLGEEARFKNAKIFYYNGDYELAEDLLSILKESTTELIANDALYLAVYIQENMGDSITEYAMAKISKADLYFYQNKNEEGFQLLKEVKDSFSSTKVMDYVYLMEGFKNLELNNLASAASNFKLIFEKYPTSIIADRAYYEYGKIQERLEQKALAKDAYLNLLTKHRDSVFNTDVRERIRKLP